MLRPCNYNGHVVFNILAVAMEVTRTYHYVRFQKRGLGHWLRWRKNLWDECKWTQQRTDLTVVMSLQFLVGLLNPQIKLIYFHCLMSSVMLFNFAVSSVLKSYIAGRQVTLPYWQSMVYGSWVIFQTTTKLNVTKQIQVGLIDHILNSCPSTERNEGLRKVTCRYRLSTKLKVVCSHGLYILY